MTRHESTARRIPVGRAHDRSNDISIGSRRPGRITLVKMDGDARARVLEDYEGAPAASHIPVAKVMCSSVRTVRSDTSIDAVTELLLDEGVGSIPVVDDAGTPLGMLSKTDILHEIRDRADTEEWLDTLSLPEPRDESELPRGYNATRTRRATAGEIMTPLCIVVREWDSLAQVAALLAYENIRQVPVVGIDGRLVGMVSRLDVSRWLAEANGYLVPKGRPR
jgi:CBS domain-containing protein